MRTIADEMREAFATRPRLAILVSLSDRVLNGPRNNDTREALRSIVAIFVWGAKQARRPIASPTDTAACSLWVLRKQGPTPPPAPDLAPDLASFYAALDALSFGGEESRENLEAVSRAILKAIQ